MSDDRPTLHDRYRGALLGAALGDALGRLTERIDRDSTLQQFGPQGIQTPPQPALYTDDTQLMMATARALIAEPEANFAALLDAATREYLDWLQRHDYGSDRKPRGPSVALVEALGRLRRGIPARMSGDASANESIVGPRAIPVALRFSGDVERIIELAAELSRLTHGHPAAVAGGAAAALLVEHALVGDDPAAWPDALERELKRWCPDPPHRVLEAVRLAEETLEWAVEDAMYEQFRARPGWGGGWTADEGIGLGWWCFRRQPNDFAAAVRLAANAYGDSDTDTIGAIAGAISGAYNGVDALPSAWLERLEDAEELTRLADALYGLSRD